MSSGSLRNGLKEQQKIIHSIAKIVIEDLVVMLMVVQGARQVTAVTMTKRELSKEITEIQTRLYLTIVTGESTCRRKQLPR